MTSQIGWVSMRLCECACLWLSEGNAVRLHPAGEVTGSGFWSFTTTDCILAEGVIKQWLSPPYVDIHVLPGRQVQS